MRHPWKSSGARQVLLLTALLLLITTFATAQGDRGTITGTVSDSAKAVVVGASVTARSSEGGATHETRSTETGNFTLPQMPAGVYDVTVSAPGFSKFVQQGIRVQVAMTARVDVVLQVGSTSESITVQADAPLLRTENADQSVTISASRVDTLPLNFGGASGDIGAMRNGLAFMLITPGVSATGLDEFSAYSVNGGVGGSFRILVEGQDITGSNATQIASDEVRPAIDAIQEYTMQTSNFAAEYGQVAGGLMNFTAKSGGNEFHGAGFEYLVNEALAAHYPFTGARPKSRKHDYGGSVGGPVLIPGLYNGRDRTFFFFNIEVYHNRITTAGRYASVPTTDYRAGNFSAALTGNVIGTDPLGRSILENTIYNPTTQRVVNGAVVRDPFTNNTIPTSMIDPVAKAIQNLIPAPSNSGLINNFEQIAPDLRVQFIPSFKIDHNITPSAKLTFFESYFNNHRWSNREGLPDPISAWRDQKIYSHTPRLSYDQSVTPTLLIHAGVGYVRYMNPDSSPSQNLYDYDAVTSIGWKGGAVKGFPRLQNLGAAMGGMSLGMGPTNANLYYNDKFTSVLSAAYIRGNHSYKIGGEFRIDSWTDRNSRGSTGVMNFDPSQTGLPSTQGQNLQGKSVGFPYASFLLGMVHDGYVNGEQDPQLRKHAYGLFVQDTWKVTRKLTLDYGLRWDYISQGHEIYYRMSMFGPTIPNPSAGGLLGGMVYEGYGQGRCNCEFTTTYPYAVQPRLGMAYQLDSKTALRAGWGMTYANSPNWSYMTNSAILGVGFNAINFPTPAAYGDAAFLMVNGPQYNKADLYAASFNPGLRPSPGQLDSPSQFLDRNGGRPGRINQWNISLQREILKDLLVEAAYVGNRGVWLQGGWGDTLVTLNALNVARIQAAGLNINNAADQAILTSRLDSPLAQSHGFTAPYAGYPMGATVAQTLRPFPQFSDLSVSWAPLGKTWYDSLQSKVTKRFSHGLDGTVAFTWQKQLAMGAGGGGPNNLFNRPNQKSFSSSSQPLVFVVAFNYQTPGLAAQNRMLHALSRDWTVGGILRYASGMPIGVPGSQNQLGSLLFQNTRMNRVPGQPLFLKNLNCNCIDPNKDFVLNPKAWSDAPAGSWGYSAAFYNDYRQARTADEQLSLGRVFRIRERMSLQIRAEFFNVFNRMKLANPDSGNPLSAQVTNSAGVPIAGFGRIDATQAGSPRNGQLVARFVF